MNINNVIYLLSKEVNYDSTNVTYITFAEKELAKNLIEIISERDSLEEDYTLEIDIPTREDDEILEEKEDNQHLDAKLHKKVIVRPSTPTPTQSSGSDYTPTQSKIKKSRVPDEKLEKAVAFYDSSPSGSRSLKVMRNRFPAIFREKHDMKRIYGFVIYNLSITSNSNNLRSKYFCR